MLDANNNTGCISLSKQDTAAMKGIAICAMLCHHLYTCPEIIGDGIVPYAGVLSWIGMLGKVCVALFLFCSGYGLATNYSPNSIKDDIKFIGRRLVKFYFNYWVIFIIFVPLTIFVFHRPLSAAYGENYVWWHLMLDVLGLQGWYSYNITWWFNTLIILLYLLFPLLYRAIRWKPWLAIIIGMIVMRLSNHVPCDTLDVCIWQFPFMLGVVWKLDENKGIRIQKWLVAHRWAAISGALCSLVITIIIRMYPIIPHWGGWRIDGFIACAVALCVITILRSSESFMAVFAFLGKHSINIYMIHTFFNGYWHPEWLHSCEWLRGGANFAILMLICLIASLGIEYMKEKIGFYKLINSLNINRSTLHNI